MYVHDKNKVFVSIILIKNRFDSFYKLQTRIYPKISKSLELKLVEEAIVSPDIISLFNHPSNTVSPHRDCMCWDNLPFDYLLYE